MSVKTPFSQQDFHQILSQYQLGQFSRAEPISQGSVQTNYLVYTTRGKYVLRYYENRSKESVLFENAVLVYLNAHDYPCPALLKNAQGIYVGTHQGKPYIIMGFIEGHHVEHPTENQKQQLIQKAAELQILTQDFVPPYKDSRWNYSGELCRKLAKEEARKLGTQEALEKLSWLENQLTALDLPFTLPKGICHCDFHFSNILFQADRFAGLIDFDDANYTYLIFDLVCLVDTWAWPFQSDVLDFQQARKIVQAYEKHRPLSPLERRHLFDVHKLSILFDCIWYFGRGPANDFYERMKIEFLNDLGREKYAGAIF